VDPNQDIAWVQATRFEIVQEALIAFVLVRREIDVLNIGEDTAGVAGMNLHWEDSLAHALAQARQSTI
jgi:hypothetical protein